MQTPWEDIYMSPDGPNEPTGGWVCLPCRPRHKGMDTDLSKEEIMHYCEDCSERRPEAELVMVEMHSPDYELYFCKGGC